MTALVNYFFKYLGETSSSL